MCIVCESGFIACFNRDTECRKQQQEKAKFSEIKKKVCVLVHI